MTLEMIMDLKPYSFDNFWVVISYLTMIAGFLFVLWALFNLDDGERVIFLFKVFGVLWIIAILVMDFCIGYKLDSWSESHVVPYVTELEANETFNVEEFVELEGEFYAVYDDGKKSVRVTDVSGVEGYLYDSLDIDVTKPENYVVSIKSVYNKLLGNDSKYSESFVDVYWVFEKE